MQRVSSRVRLPAICFQITTPAPPIWRMTRSCCSTSGFPINKGELEGRDTSLGDNPCMTPQEQSLNWRVQSGRRATERWKANSFLITGEEGTSGSNDAIEVMDDTESTEVKYKIRQWSLPSGCLMLLAESSGLNWITKLSWKAVGCYRENPKKNSMLCSLTRSDATAQTLMTRKGIVGWNRGGQSMVEDLPRLDGTV